MNFKLTIEPFINPKTISRICDVLLRDGYRVLTPRSVTSVEGVVGNLIEFECHDPRDQLGEDPVLSKEEEPTFVGGTLTCNCKTCVEVRSKQDGK